MVGAVADVVFKEDMKRLWHEEKDSRAFVVKAVEIWKTYLSIMLKVAALEVYSFWLNISEDLLRLAAQFISISM